MEAPADSTWNGFSLAERDRRWQAVRNNATREGLDCVFVPLCLDGTNLRLSLEQARGVRSDGRYLTQMENAAVVLPTDGRPPIVINDRGAGNAWVPDARPASRGMRGSWGTAMAEALLDAGLERGRIGVSGLARGKVTHARAVDGVVNHTAYADVMRRLPNATFVDATDVVGFARYVKSDEEIACVRCGAAIAAAGVDEMVAVARPGVDEAVLYARVMRRMMELGSEYYPLALYTGPIDEHKPRMENPPIGRQLQPNYLITNETDAVWGGLIAQEVQPIVLGPIPEPWKPVIELHRDLYRAGLEFMKPGTVFNDMIEFVNGFGAQRGMKTLILMHGRGYGNDGPLLTPQDTRAAHIRDVVIEKGNIWVWKPIAYSADDRIQFSWGGCVVVTDRGGEPLANRTHGMVSITEG
jgi:Xaa-Pro aminopeptidase